MDKQPTQQIPVPPASAATATSSELPPKKPFRFFSTKKIIITLVIAIILFTAFYIGIYANLNSQLNKITNTPPTSSTKTSSTPTPDPTANWKTYENTKYGYILKYPPTWNQVTSNTPINELVLSEKGAFYVFTIVSDANNDPKTGKPYIHLVDSIGPYQENWQKIIIDQEDGLKSPTTQVKTVAAHSLTAVNVFSKDKKTLYKITFKIQTLNDKSGSIIFDQILSTFKFTE